VTDDPARVVIRRDADNFWQITEATNATERGVDQATVTGVVGIVATLAYNDSFSLEEAGRTLADYGLEEPQYEIVLATSDAEYHIYLGNKNPGETRYYARLNDDADTVYLVASDIADNVVRYIDQPPYVPAPTPTATATATPNPYSEVEMTQTAQAQFDATATAFAEMATSTPSAVGPEAPEGVTEEPLAPVTTEEAEEATEEAEEATEAVTEEATETVTTEEATEAP